MSGFAMSLKRSAIWFFDNETPKGGVKIGDVFHIDHPCGISLHLWEHYVWPVYGAQLYL